jgi:hypothetical protein
MACRPTLPRARIAFGTSFLSSFRTGSVLRLPSSAHERLLATPVVPWHLQLLFPGLGGRFLSVRPDRTIAFGFDVRVDGLIVEKLRVIIPIWFRACFCTLVLQNVRR